MNVIEPGHVYELRVIDGKRDETETLYFVNREPGTEHSGTQTQEVLRALIDRTMHCDNCLRWPGNDLIIHHLRMALVLHEARALERKTEKGYIRPELIEIGDDGHFTLVEESRRDEISEDEIVYLQKPKPDSPYVEKKPEFCTK